MRKRKELNDEEKLAELGFVRVVPPADKEEKEIRKELKLQRRRYWVAYDLAYDGGGSRWFGYYNGYIRARLAIFWNVHFGSWGGTAHIKDTRPPTRGDVML